jgi:hypothetical protein
MNLIDRKKTLVNVNLAVWARVRYFATIKKLSVNEALELLLTRALNKYGYRPQKGILPNATKILADSGQQAAKELSR